MASTTASAATLFMLLLCAPTLSLAYTPSRVRNPSPLWRRASSSRSVPPAGFYNPSANGASATSKVAPNTGGLGEPLNVIVSGNSDELVLADNEDKGGFRNWMISVGFASECLGQHAGDAQTANLGDGNGQLNETSELRWDYGDPNLGTCKETIDGGNHFRYWIQDGPSGNRAYFSGAFFLATSYEMPIQDGHNIIFDGDWLVGNATAQSHLIPTGNITNGTTYSGKTSFANYTYSTDALYLTGILSNSSSGLNHASSVGGDGVEAVDGLVAVLTVKVLSTPPPSANGALPSLSTPWWPLGATLLLATLTLSQSLLSLST
uniref:Acetolactate synthase (EC) n=1 Tax=Ganoderma boninense TaxID=34458 RepID=A0A5K1JVN7_9APHY|nr:Acetolactate synthase (EC [Ganoderma boninense]